MPHSKKLFRGIVFAAIVLLLAGYVYYQSRTFLSGPEIIVSSPENGATRSNPLVTVSGTAKHITHISINDRGVFVDEEGKFSDTLLVLPGLTIIEIAAGDRFGRTVEKTIQVVYQKKPEERENTGGEAKEDTHAQDSDI